MNNTALTTAHLGYPEQSSHNGILPYKETSTREDYENSNGILSDYQQQHVNMPIVSMDIPTSDLHPFATSSTSETVVQTIATPYGDHFTSQVIDNEEMIMWPSVTIPSDSCSPSYTSSASSPVSSVDMYSAFYTTEEDLSSSSMRKSFNNSCNTVAWCNPSEKELRSPSFSIEKSTAEGSFGHLSREELIKRVVELEREKRLTSSKMSIKEDGGPNSTTATISDEEEVEEIHSCRWSGCDTSATSLDQLIAHIKEAHIGSGKPAYYCEWESCPREQKPFLKRHKMQNHMRTHTGERPFVCHVEDCDKKFSRPDSLNTHIKTHSNVRPYACPYENCTKAYFHSRSLRKHTKSHEAANNSNPTATSGVNLKAPIKEDVIFQRQHPYDRSQQPPRHYRQQPLCEEDNTNFAPMTINTAVIQQQPFATTHLYGDVKMMEQHQQQQTFAAGTAYTMQPSIGYSYHPPPQQPEYHPLLPVQQVHPSSYHGYIYQV